MGGRLIDWLVSLVAAITRRSFAGCPLPGCVVRCKELSWYLTDWVAGWLDS